MKTTYWVIGVVIVVLALGGWWFLSGGEAPSIVTPKPERVAGDEAKLLATLKAAEITVPEFNLKVTLQAGEADFTDGEMVAGSVKLVEVLGQKALADGSYDIFANLAVETGGTGTFNYVGLFHLTVDGVTNTSSTFVGDRVAVEGVAVGADLPEGGYRLSINYLGRAADEPLAAEPTVADSLEVRVVDHQITGLKY